MQQLTKGHRVGSMAGQASYGHFRWADVVWPAGPGREHMFTMACSKSRGQHGWAGAPPGQRAGAAQQHSWAAQLLLASPSGPLASTVHSPHPALPALGGHGNMSDLNISPEQSMLSQYCAIHLGASECCRTMYPIS